MKGRCLDTSHASDPLMHALIVRSNLIYSQVLSQRAGSGAGAVTERAVAEPLMGFFAYGLLRPAAGVSKVHSPGFCGVCSHAGHGFASGSGHALDASVPLWWCSFSCWLPQCARF